MCQSFIKQTTTTISDITNHQFHSNLSQEEKLESIIFTNKDIQNSLKKQQASKPMGFDNISAQFIKSHETILTPILTNIFNSLLQEGQMPEILKTTLILPLYKGRGSKNDISSYRPISILSSIAKVLENAVYQKMMDFLDSPNKLNEQQHGYRRNRSTMTAVLLLTEAIRHAGDKKLFTVVSFIDFSSAFCCLIYPILFKNLQCSSA